MKKLFTKKSGIILKLFIYQFAMSLLGLFVASPFKNGTLILAGIFSTLFYFSLVTYAVIEDGQKDFIAVSSGREQGSVLTGLKYALVSYIPTMFFVILNCILNLFVSNVSFAAVKSLINIVVRFFLMGMYLGIDAGLTNYSYDPVLEKSVSNAPEWVRFLSDNGITFVIFLVLFPIVSGISYALAYKGKIHVNTQSKKKN